MLFWSGTWKILDLFLLPHKSSISSWISLGIGSFIPVLGYFVAELLKTAVRVECSFQNVFLSRLFIYINAVGHLNYWRGIWNLSDSFIGKELLASSLSFFISHFILVFLKSSGNSLGQPFLMVMDTRDNFYESTPKFRSKV